MTTRTLPFNKAIHEALDQSLETDPSTYLMGLGVPDPKGVFGTTKGLQEKHGEDRVFDMPTSENGMTGVAIGSAITGMRPIMTHQRIDFAILAMEQIVNQASKWNYMYGGKMSVPLVIRMIIGRGWGQGPQHSQNLQSWFAHVPGLKVVMPTTAHDAKGLLIASIEDNNPVIFLEHRWLYQIEDEVPEQHYDEPLGEAKVLREGSDITLASVSYMTVESIKAANLLQEKGISAEVLDIRSLKPLDRTSILNSVRKTGQLVVCDTGWKSFGAGAEIISSVVEDGFEFLDKKPRRVCSPDSPTPTTRSLTKHYYPRHTDIAREAMKSLGFPDNELPEQDITERHDVPNPDFTGPF